MVKIGVPFSSSTTVQSLLRGLIQMWWTIILLSAGVAFASVTPEFNCVDDLGGDTCRFWWGYANNETGNVSLTVGPDNSFVPSPQDRGQNTFFSAQTSEVNAFSYDASCAGNVDTWSLNHTSLESDITNVSETCSNICGNGCLEFTEIFTEAGDPPHDCVRYIFKQLNASCFVQFFWISIPQAVTADDIMVGECGISFKIDHAPPCTTVVNSVFPSGKFLKVNLDQGTGCTSTDRINATVGISLGVALNSGGIGPVVIKVDLEEEVADLVLDKLVAIAQLVTHSLSRHHATTLASAHAVLLVEVARNSTVLNV